ncbi:hypothetical protein [Paenibacillus sp. FSL R7-0273]|uniref:hypothetical protein n=1 Tax=Paenibacillus sp. FSL R7-0273 TaxID=1536772 RepID=UPI0009F81FC8|nr:hypothetical protein [Paenibacillus sp. FSL R7-0273]
MTTHMDKQVAILVDITLNITNRLNTCSFEELEEFVEERQILIDSIRERFSGRSSFSIEEESHLKAVLRRDPEILERMQQLKSEAAKWLQQRELAKAQRNAYEAVYTPGSILMDRKK